MKEKELEYAALLSQKVLEIFNEESDVFIDLKELNKDNNLTHFIHALATVMPTHIYTKLTGDNKNNLEFNHLANKLVFQYSEKEN